jgi:TatD DNase family protein
VNLSETHCHLDFNKFDHDRQAVIQRALEAGVRRILIPSINLESSKAVVKLIMLHPVLFGALGIHPTKAGKWNEETRSELRGLVKLSQSAQSTENKVVAIGEIGLDYYWNSVPHDMQRLILIEQLGLARELNLPVIIHSREKDDAEQGNCATDLMKILEEWVVSLKEENTSIADHLGVLHSFSGTLEIAKRAIQLGFYIGVTGPVTYKNAERRRQIIACLPLDRLLIETDAPFLTPIPRRGMRNEPAFVGHIADKIAEIHMTTREQVAEITSANASRLFGWGG